MRVLQTRAGEQLQAKGEVKGRFKGDISDRQPRGDLMAESSPPIPSKVLSTIQMLQLRPNATLLEKLWEKFKDNLTEPFNSETVYNPDFL